MKLRKKSTRWSWVWIPRVESIFPGRTLFFNFFQCFCEEYGWVTRTIEIKQLTLSQGPIFFFLPSLFISQTNSVHKKYLGLTRHQNLGKSTPFFLFFLFWRDYVFRKKRVLPDMDNILFSPLLELHCRPFKGAAVFLTCQSDKQRKKRRRKRRRRRSLPPTLSTAFISTSAKLFLSYFASPIFLFHYMLAPSSSSSSAVEMGGRYGLDCWTCLVGVYGGP